MLPNTQTPPNLLSDFLPPETAAKKEARKLREDAAKVNFMQWIGDIQTEIYGDPPMVADMEDWNDTSKLDREMYAMVLYMKKVEAKQAAAKKEAAKQEEAKKMDQDMEEMPEPVNGIIHLHNFPYIVDPDYFRPRKVYRCPNTSEDESNKRNFLT